MVCQLKFFIELPVLLIFFCFMLSDYVTTNFVLYRTCYISMGFNETDCALLGSGNASAEIKDLESKVQPKATLIMMTRTIIDSTIPVFMSLTLGPWSNKHGRKPIFISTLIGYLCAYLVVITLCLLPWTSPWWWLISCVAASSGGGFCSMLTVCFCYIADVTSDADRGMRMGILEAAVTLGSLLGTICSSYVFAALGYIGVYSICAGITFIAVLYSYFFVSESVNNIQSEDSAKDLFDTSVIVKTIKTCFKRRQNKDRLLLCLLISILVLYIFVIFSDSGVFFYFVREKFNWSLNKYTIFSSVNSLIEVVNTMFILYVLHKVLKIDEIILLIFGMTSLCVSSVIYGIASQEWLIYLGSAIKRFGCTIGPLGRSAISKLIPPDELGHVFAFTTSLESITQVVGAPLYTLLYNKTLLIYPSAFNYLSALLYAGNIGIASIVAAIRERYPSPDISIST